MKGSLVLALLAGLLPVVVAADENEISTLKSLLNQGQAVEAFQQAQAVQDQYIGDSEFDFYYGLAALDSGHAELAVMAFERILYQTPESPRVRLELGRALYAVADYNGAEKQFNQVLDHDPPERVRERVKVLLTNIESLKKNFDPQLSAYAGLNSGYDTNFISATSAQSFEFSLGTVFFSDESRKQSSGYSEAEAGVGLNWPVTENQVRFANLDYGKTANWENSLYDSDQVSLSLGVMQKFGEQVLRLPFSAQATYLDGKEYRYTANLGADWIVPVSNLTQWISFGQAYWIRNPDNSTRDSNLYVLGTGVATVLPSIRTKFMSSLSIGHDNALELDVFGKVFAGMRLGAQVSVGPTLMGFLNLDAQQARYEAQGGFLNQRKDLFTQVQLGSLWTLGHQMTVNFTLSYSDNHSNLELYAYNRTQASIGFEYLWE